MNEEYASLRSRREAICSKCDKNKLNFCSECGCLIPLKISFPFTACPLKKWSSLIDENQSDK